MAKVPVKERSGHGKRRRWSTIIQHFVSMIRDLGKIYVKNSEWFLCDDAQDTADTGFTIKLCTYLSLFDL